MSLDLGLENKVVVISGATGGIGGQVCKDLISEGAIVCCLVRNEEKFNSLKEALYNSEKLHSYKCNILNPTEIAYTFKPIFKEHLTIDVLINGAGAALEIPFALCESEDIDHMVNINLKSPMYLSKAALRYMFKQRSGSIINISSVSAVKKGRGIVAYAAAKGGLETFTRVLAQEVGKKGIRVNGIRPGAVQTDMSSNLESLHEERVKGMVALQRFGHVQDVSKAVLFAASNEASAYMTGEMLTIDGGTD